MGSLTSRLLSIPVEETRISRRGFHVRDAAAGARLETIGETFLCGYHAALLDQGGPALARSLHTVRSHRAMDVTQQALDVTQEVYTV